MSMPAENDKSISTDRMKYVKNSKSALLCYLAIIFDVLYFVSIYESDVGPWYYQLLTGSSIIYNLVFMLLVFLASEGVKNYKLPYSYLLIAAGVLQIARIFLLPLKAMRATSVVNGAVTAVMGTSQAIIVIVCLSLSAVCLFAAALINIRKCSMLKKHAGEKQAYLPGTEGN